MADFGGFNTFNSGSAFQDMIRIQQEQMQRMNQAVGQRNAARHNVQLSPAQGQVSGQAGSVYIHDTFVPSGPLDLSTPSGETHGSLAAGAARGTGFRGRIVGTDRANAGIGRLDRQAMELQDRYSTPGRTREQTIADLRAYSGTRAGALLDQQTQYLNRLTASGANRSVANLSLGRSKASGTLDLYEQMMPALRLDRNENDPAFARANGMLQNVARAAGVDVSRLRSPDERVRNAERGRMTQFLINQVSQGMDQSPALASARRNYGTAVRNFEARNNSVVIAAGNEGQHLTDLREAHGGYRLSAPRDFSRNVLQNNDVTSVGATDDTGGRERRAAYTGNSPGIDIYADGGTGARGFDGREIDGTSFAAPRVAATMAELHRRNPNMSSAQIENLMRAQLSEQVRGSGETALDRETAARYLSGRTF